MTRLVAALVVFGFGAIAVAADPEKPADRACWSEASVLSANLPFLMNGSFFAFSRLRQTRTVGGVSETEHAAITVAPLLPAGPSVVTT